MLSAATIRELSNLVSLPDSISPIIPSFPPLILFSSLFKSVCGEMTSIISGIDLELKVSSIREELSTSMVPFESKFDCSARLIIKEQCKISPAAIEKVSFKSNTILVPSG